MLVEPTVRQARPSDEGAIRDVARRSLRASYSLSPNVIASAVEQWYPRDGAADGGTRTDALVLVATRGDEVVGYSESTIHDGEDRGDIRWLHVDPDHRGQGIGSCLLERTRSELEDRGVARLRGRVLADNREGNSFYADHGFELVGRDTVELDARTYVENVYGTTRGIRIESAPDGRHVYVDADSTESGSQAPFRVVYTDRRRDERYGFFCSNCESLATAMDPMGRVQCGNCDNVRRPTRWDAAYM